MVWLVFVKAIIGVGTLAVISWAEHAHDEAVAHTMGVVTFSLFAVAFSMTARDELRSAFSLDTLNDKTFAFSTGLSLGTFCSRPSSRRCRHLGMTTLDARQRPICAAVACVGPRRVGDPQDRPPTKRRESWLPNRADELAVNADVR